ncbi:MAG TPA: LPS export ABC transporter permease LptF [Beijerinckiaceae bacterium]|nr:LPS export ABC transporter permease LptF [Beijerinckiaceae bacterium]
MNLIERYIFRIAASALLACLFVLTAVIWVTQALRELDLITGKGQTMVMFLMVTGLSLPTLVTVIAPVALFIATLYTLNRLNGDSELIVMSAAGIPPRRLLKPFLVLAVLVSGLVGVMTLWVIPASFQELRDLITKIRADFVANIVKEGQFTSLENGVTFHFRERSGEALLGILIQDRREPGRTVVYLAQRGQVMDANEQSYLVLESGTVHRQESSGRDTSIVAFARYAVDLAAFNQEEGLTVYKPRERSTGQLLFPDRNELYFQLQQGRFRAELHERLSAWLYPLALMLIAFAALGGAQTTRQGRGTALVAAVVAVAAMRIAGFAASGAAVRSAGAVVWIWGVPILTFAAALVFTFQGPRTRAAIAAATGLVQRLAALRLPVPIPTRARRA